jgi:hypothetical protein
VKPRVCDVCGDAIGSYEPLVWVAPGGPRHGGLLTFLEHPDFDPEAAPLMHRDCAPFTEDDR